MRFSTSRSLIDRACDVIATIAILSMASVCIAAESEELSIATSDGARHALVFRAGAGAQPTVLVLHGATGTAAITARSTGFAEAAARRGLTAVFPDGLNRRWNDGRIGGPSGQGGPDDVAFLRALVARLISDRIAQADKIFIAGISNGGMMSFTMACKASDLFAGIGTVIANMPAGIEPCAFKPMPLVMVNGTADRIVPFEGGNVGRAGGRGSVWGVQRTVALFAQIDGCASAPSSQSIKHRDPTQETSSVTSVTLLEWTGCKAGTSVQLYRVDGGGHSIAGRRASVGGLPGSSTDDTVAADVIVDVFVETFVAR